MYGPPIVQHVVVVSNFFTALSFLIVILRLYTRSQIVRIVSVEDYLIVVSMVSTLLSPPSRFHSVVTTNNSGLGIFQVANCPAMLTNTNGVPWLPET